jgi:membrane-associated protease RseP (regulator of RpoE activity)
MSKLGLDDDIIIAKIKNGSCEFQLEETDLVGLKKAGVSSKVIAAMLDSSVLTSPRVTVDKNEVPIHTMGQSKVGGRLGHDVTLGFKSVKEKAYLDGPHSTIVSGSSPLIEIDLPKGDTIDNYILVQMDEKSDRRELEVEARGGLVGANNGIRAEAIHKTHVTPLGGNKFQLGTDALKKGEYIIYVVGSPDSIKGIYGKGYDFTVSDVEKVERPSIRKETLVQPATGAPPDHPPSTIHDPEPPANSSAGGAEESRIGVWFTGNPTVKHDGLEISGVEPKGPADNIDIKPGDVIIALDGHYLYTIDDLRAELRRHGQGGRLAIRYRRDRLTYENYLALTSKDAAPPK